MASIQLLVEESNGPIHLLKERAILSTDRLYVCPHAAIGRLKTGEVYCCNCYKTVARKKTDAAHQGKEP